MNCDLCGADDPRLIVSSLEYGDPVHVCGRCGFVHVITRRSSEEIVESWTDLFGETYSSAWPAVQARLNYVRAFFEENDSFEGKSIIEIGAGEGAFLDMVRNRGAYPVAIEPSPINARKLIKLDIAVLRGTIEQIPAPGTYDLVAILWTLENCQDCMVMLEKARKMLMPGGKLIVATGSRVLVPFKKPLGSYFSNNPGDTHCFRFSVNSLGRALAKAGLKVDRMGRYFDSDWLVMVASAGEMVEPPYDDSEEVLQFFEDWRRMFP